MAFWDVKPCSPRDGYKVLPEPPASIYMVQKVKHQYPDTWLYSTTSHKTLSKIMLHIFQGFKKVLHTCHETRNQQMLVRLTVSSRTLCNRRNKKWVLFSVQGELKCFAWNWPHRNCVS